MRGVLFTITGGNRNDIIKAEALTIKGALQIKDMIVRSCVSI
ncbi:MAG: hypothetical protein P857_1103 [Candidatus Xenolissoclinum pacificiensis L6]|uniref:Uncharacterized protein n=1 Tax=Candidatus Xenolissoclinum pacificiensis L6 TaxID=1401685 RepID=W2V383_9RICK|nr:MAG: hypothetical protein P857_1103 [Candidatus Xenolissoclinum pacificiensis L6]